MSVTVTTEINPWPYCGGTSGVQLITDTSPKVQDWSALLRLWRTLSGKLR